MPCVLRVGYLRRTSLHESITSSVGLLLSTRVGQMPFDPKFGCDVWEKEFSDLYTANKANLRASLRNTIDRFEKRLHNVSVSFTSTDTARLHVLGMTVKVKGNYRDDEGKEQMFESSYLLG